MRYVKFTLLIVLFLTIGPLQAQLTIGQCVEKAQENYPVIKRYGILDSFKEIDLSDIDKTWLPKVGVYGQLTGQNTVPSYPEALSKVLEQFGQEVKGLSKIQYKIGIDLTQTIWDGGASAVSRDIVKAREETNRASLDVELYAIRERVENFYFAILLSEQQITQSETTARLLEANLIQLQSMLKNGVAMQSDCDMVLAQLLSLTQKIEEAKVTRDGLRRVLEIYIGESLDNKSLILPQPMEVEDRSSRRPELRLFDRRESLNLLADKMTEMSLMPKVGFFAQAYYGYPGFDYFKSMMKRSLSFNILAGVKVSWNIDALYTKKNSLRQTQLNSESIQNERELFLFNTEIASEQQRFVIEAVRKSMAEDARIVELRANVRKAAESQLQNGVIDATALLSKITDENQAALTAKLHEIQYIQQIYKLKYLLNQ